MRPSSWSINGRALVSIAHCKRAMSFAMQHAAQFHAMLLILKGHVDLSPGPMPVSCVKEKVTQWQACIALHCAAKFADQRLRRSGRCHESEVRDALQKADRRLRGPNSLSESALRDMIRNWHPAADRTATGYYKNMSLRAQVDPFTGQTIGSEDAVPASRRQAEQ